MYADISCLSKFIYTVLVIQNLRLRNAEMHPTVSIMVFNQTPWSTQRDTAGAADKACLNTPTHWGFQSELRTVTAHFFSPIHSDQIMSHEGSLFNHLNGPLPTSRSLPRRVASNQLVTQIQPELEVGDARLCSRHGKEWFPVQYLCIADARVHKELQKIPRNQ